MSANAGWISVRGEGSVVVAQLFWEVGLSDDLFDLGGNNDRTFAGLLELVPYQLAIDLSESLGFHIHSE